MPKLQTVFQQFFVFFCRGFSVAGRKFKRPGVHQLEFSNLNLRNVEIYSPKNYTLEVQDQTKNVFLKDDPCREFPILPMGKVWSVDFLGIHLESHPSKKKGK